MIIFLASLVILRSAAAADVGYFWHVSDFHLDPRYGSNVTRAGARDIFLGDYDEVSMSCTVCSDGCYLFLLAGMLDRAETLHGRLQL